MNEWLKSLWVLWHFPCCCTVELSWIYCIAFLWGERFRVTFTAILWWLFVNCTVHNYTLCSFCWDSISNMYSLIFFPLSDCGKSNCTAPRVYPPLSFFFRAMIKRNLNCKYILLCWNMKNMNVTMYLNEFVKGFKNEGPKFLFMLSYFWFTER